MTSLKNLTAARDTDILYSYIGGSSLSKASSGFMTRRLWTDCIVPFEDYLVSGKTYVKKPNQIPQANKTTCKEHFSVSQINECVL